ncbi:2-keto-gluconate dehydrogenase [Sulfodiicoccus acidiphilus]|uniref:2-keto-gluconate dehydrogenase n=1 Tax=Sulfodiicoccus acidiphilus TaxID=1670455 RepID=A0A348B1J7_9CREN|nr:2-keto-gluconate dehydrogenase [Sulfodiicoccus acidiphilus]GGU00159.1 2-keto-gluconate dehydrogenase [Sulfodiicoccus acidiphilus]
MYDYHAIIVGSGAAGGLVAYRLSMAGKKVAIIERGGYYGTNDFTRFELDAYRKLWWEPRWTSNSELFGDMDEISLGMGRCVGGSTTIFTAVAHRAPAWNLKEWYRETKVTNERGEPLTLEDLEPRYERIERETRVRRYTEWDAGTRLIAKGFEKMGLKAEAVNAYVDVNCDQSGCLFGCPTEAKRGSLVSYIVPSLYAGADLFPNSTVREVLVERTQEGLVAKGIKFLDSEGRAVELKSKVVVVAAGALETPQILLRSKLRELSEYSDSSLQIGKNLAANTGTIVFGRFRDTLRNWLIHPISAEVPDFAEREGFLLQFSESMEGPLGFAEVVTDPEGRPLVGGKLKSLLMNYGKVAGIFVTIHDSNNGEVRLDSNGNPVFYKPVTRGDRRIIRRAREVAEEALRLAGAEEVFHSILLSHHVQGTCRMGEDTSKSVVNSHLESHDVKNLFVPDGSAIPSVLDVNPSLTIYALADIAAEYMLRNNLKE